MDPARWQRLEDVFVRALDVPAADQRSFVAAECSNDEPLRDEVLALLEDDRRARESIHDIVAAGARSAAGSSAVEARRDPAGRPPGIIGVIVALLMLTVATLLVGRFVLLDLVAGTTDARELRTWQLDVPDGARDQVVTLPGALRDHLPARTVDYTLRTTVPLSPAQQGHALALLVDCFHAPLSASVDGSPLLNFGEGIGGTWRFVISDSLTRRESIQIELVVHRDFIGSTGIGVAPRLADDPRGDARTRRIGAFNHYSAIAALALQLMLAFLYAVLLRYEGVRRGHVAMVLVCLTSCNVAFMQLGYFEAIFGGLALNVASVVGVANALALVTFVRGAFGLSPLTRRWFVTGVAYASFLLGSAASFSLTSMAQSVNGLVVVVVNLYVGYLCLRAMRVPGLRSDAAMILFGGVPTLPCIIQGMVWVATGHNPLDGLHPYPIALMISTASLALILGRQHAARQRTIERTAEELRRQVAERSKELATALGKFAEHSNVSLGRVIDGRYRVVRHLGTGGMGAVFEVERITDQARFALKTVRERVDPRQLARLAREAQLAAQITHSNLVSVVDVGLADGTLYLVMELVDGGSLDDERAKFGNAKWARPLLEQIASGLAALHDKGIVHRDLKPANVLLSRGVARIADFGIASVRATDSTQQLTRTGDVFGTPMYMAPELALGSNTATPAADIFSFGVLACEVLTGTRPFREPPLLARVNDAAMPVASTAGLDPGLRPILERCLASDPANRPTATELVDHFRG